MRRTILIVVVLLLIAVPAYAQYNIHLKNGSVIRGVPSYKEVDGELRFSYLGGTLGIPLDDVLKVEEARTGDVEIAPKKAYVSLRRNKQFGLIQPSTKTRIDLGINLNGAKATGRLEASGSFNAMVSHRVRLSTKAEVNKQLIDWLKRAYAAS